VPSFRAVLIGLYGCPRQGGSFLSKIFYSFFPVNVQYFIDFFATELRLAETLKAAGISGKIIFQISKRTGTDPDAAESCR
jgi:hypothetical protein